MFKKFLLSVLIVLCTVTLSFGANVTGIFFQKRLYETGEKLTRTFIYLDDYSVDATKIELTRNGVLVDEWINPPTASYIYDKVGYNGHHWYVQFKDIFLEEYELNSTYEEFPIDDYLPTDTYRATVYFSDGTISYYERQGYYFKDLPIINAYTNEFTNPTGKKINTGVDSLQISVIRNADGDLVIEWIPQVFNSESFVQTRIFLLWNIDFSQLPNTEWIGDKNIGIIGIDEPAQMGIAIIPSELVDDMKLETLSFYLLLSLDNGSNRSYSTPLSFDLE